MRNRPRPAFVVLVILTLVAAGLGLWLVWMERLDLAAQSQPSIADAPQALAPDFTLPTLDGGAVSLANLRGKVIMLNFWATWCAPCAAEMPDLDALQRQYGEAHDFVVLGVNLQEDSASVESFVRAHGLTFPILLDSDGQVTQSLYQVRPLPTSVVIDRQGFIRDVWNGQIRREAMLTRLKNVW